MNLVYLLLGSNLGDRALHLSQAMQAINIGIGKVIGQSSVYQSEPWGFLADEAFLNQVVIIETDLTPHQVMDKALRIEKELGRERSLNGDYQSRTIDIDILFFNHEIIEDQGLVIPHPRIQDRKFTLMPLLELNGGMMHPAFSKTIVDLFRECNDPLKVEVYRGRP